MNYVVAMNVRAGSHLYDYLGFVKKYWLRSQRNKKKCSFFTFNLMSEVIEKQKMNCPDRHFEPYIPHAYSRSHSPITL